MTADEGGWETVGPSAIPFSDYPAPRELTKAEIQELTAAHVRSVERAERIGFDLIQMHGGHGYLIHQFLSPLRSEEHTSELQSLMRISYAVFCLKKKTKTKQIITTRSK